MKSLFLAGLLAAVARGAGWRREWLKEEVDSFSQTDMKEMFAEWSQFFGRDYINELTEARRYGIWLENLDKIGTMNSEGHSFKLALNDFADMTDEEFYDRYSCLTREKGTPYQNGLVVDGDTSGLPDSVDWTTQGVVTPIKNQGQCGSCWAFSATGDMECDYAIKTGTLNSLSEQELVDCSGSYGNYGCSGGWYYNAWNYAEAEGGLCTEAEYPYTARDGSCKDKTCGTKYNDPKTYSRVTPDSDTSLATASAGGCVSVAIEADQTAFQYYSSGVLTGTCGTSIDHAVLVVGYGTQGSQEYWKVKNSWGTSWGENGYVLICRNCNKNGNRGECGINMYPYVVDY